MDRLRILCFGDSLTEGFTNGGTSFHPYAESLTASLEKAFPRTKLEVHVEGVSGDKVCPPGSFIRRIKARCETGTYDWVILLGGTNDLGWGGQPDKILSCLQEVEQVALDNGSNILIMTVPEVSLKKKDLDERRDELNASIREQCDDLRIFLLDLHEKIPYHSLPANQRKEIWDDGVHFTPKGYDLMGDFIFERLVQLIPLCNTGKLNVAQDKVGVKAASTSQSDVASDAEYTEKDLHGTQENLSRAEKWSCGMCVLQ